MPHSVFDERGEMLHQTHSEIVAFAYCLQRQRTGKLTTMLLDSGAEIMFAPFMQAGKRAETALEYKSRVEAEVKEEMAQDTGLLLPFSRMLQPWRK